MHPPEISELYSQAQAHLQLLLGLGLFLFFMSPVAFIMFLLDEESSRKAKWLRAVATLAIVGSVVAWLSVDGTNTQATLRREEAKHQAASIAYYKDSYGLTFDYYDDLQRLQLGETVDAELDGKPALVSLTGPYDHQKLIASDSNEVHEVRPRR